MQSPSSFRHGLLVLSMSLAVLPVWAEDDCDAPVNRWQTRDAVRQMAAAKGWQIQRLKIDDGCYEIRAIDAEGRAFKAKLDPQTLSVLKLKPDEHQRAQEHERAGKAAEQAEPPPPTNANAPTHSSAPSSTPGSAPRGQAE